MNSACWRKQEEAKRSTFISLVMISSNSSATCSVSERRSIEINLTKHALNVFNVNADLHMHNIRTQQQYNTITRLFHISTEHSKLVQERSYLCDVYVFAVHSIHIEWPMPFKAVLKHRWSIGRVKNGQVVGTELIPTNYPLMTHLKWNRTCFRV